MKKIQLNKLQLWQFESLAQFPEIKHFVSERGAATDNGKEFTLSFSSSPDPQEIRANRSELAAAMGIVADRLYFPSQVHKTRVVLVNRHTTKEELQETDALITNKKGICVAVLSADCVPILLYDQKNKAVGAVHAGWRGTVAKILTSTMQQMHAAFGTTGENLVACIGPSVSQDAYEVGTEVVQAVQQAFSNHKQLLIPQAEGKAKLDLWKANQLQLLEFGVPPTAIEVANLCTVKENRYFFSARKGDAGRFAAGIMLV